MADRHVVYKLAAKEIADAHGHALTFMAKWDAARAGSSLHLHASLWSEGDEPLFAGEEPLEGTRLRASADLPALPRRPARPRAGAVLVLRADGELVQALPRRHLRADGHRLERRQPHRRLPRRGQRPLAARRVPHPRRRRQPLPRLRGAPRGGARRRRAAPRARPGLRGRRLRSRPGCRACRPRSPRPSPSSSARAFARKAFGDEVVEHLLHFARAEQAYFEAVVTDWEKRRYFERV